MNGIWGEISPPFHHELVGKFFVVGISPSFRELRSVMVFSARYIFPEKFRGTNSSFHYSSQDIEGLKERAQSIFWIDRFIGATSGTLVSHFCLKMGRFLSSFLRRFSDPFCISRNCTMAWGEAKYLHQNCAKIIGCFLPVDLKLATSAWSKYMFSTLPEWCKNIMFFCAIVCTILVQRFF